MVPRRALAAGRRITHIVFMGMGEPLANYDGDCRRCASSTDQEGLRATRRGGSRSRRSGWRRRSSGWARGELRVNLAVSLNATTDELRDRLVPVNRGRHQALSRPCRRFPLPSRQRITFEYVLLKGVNDSEADARRWCSCSRDPRPRST